MAFHRGFLVVFVGALGCGHAAPAVAVPDVVAAAAAEVVPTVVTVPVVRPVVDVDGDGVEDVADRCGEERETRNGYEDADGCPDEVPIQLATFGPAMGVYFEATPGVSLPTSGRESREAVHAGEDGFVAVTKARRVEPALRRDPEALAWVRAALIAGLLPQRRVIDPGALFDAFEYDYPRPVNGALGLSLELGPCPWEPTHRLVQIGVQAGAVPVSARALVFVVDVSDSMRVPERLPAVKRVLTSLLAELRVHDRVGLVVYGSTAGRVLPLTPVAQREAIVAALAGLEHGGTSAQGVGLPLAHALLAGAPEPRRGVVVITDGDAGLGSLREQIYGARELDAQIDRRTRGATMMAVIDVGDGEGHAARSLAQAGGGEVRRATSPAMLDRALRSVVGSTEIVARGVRLEVVFDASRVTMYRRIDANVHTSGPVRRGRATGLDLRAGEAVTVVYEVVPTGVMGPVLTATVRGKTGRGAAIEVRRGVEAAANPGPGSADFRLAAAIAGVGSLLGTSGSVGDAAQLAVLARTAITPTSRDDRGELAAWLGELAAVDGEVAELRAARTRWLQDNTPTPEEVRVAGALAPASVKALRGVAVILREFPTLRLEIGGHCHVLEADTEPGREAIALARARVIAGYLVIAEGMDPNRLVVRAAGSREPIDTNATARGRAHNRRAEFKILVDTSPR